MIRILALLAAFAATPLTAQCRQALALGLDVSASVDPSEYRLQLDGLAAAFTHPDIAKSLLAMPAAPVRITVYEWSEPGYQRLLTDWTEIRTQRDIAALAQSLRTTRRAVSPPGTAVGSAMQYGGRLLAQQPDCWKRTLDLSGDGKHNMGPHPRDLKPALAATGITINGLVIGADTTDNTDRRLMQIGEISAYYNAWVILGPDAFVEVALGFAEYEAAMIRKLKRELAGLTLSALPTRLAQRRLGSGANLPQ